jgi:hypothetical protein
VKIDDGGVMGCRMRVDTADDGCDAPAHAVPFL